MKVAFLVTIVCFWHIFNLFISNAVPTKIFLYLILRVYCCMGLFHPRCWTLHLTLFTFLRFLSVHFSILPWSISVSHVLHCTDHSHLSLLSSADLLRVLATLSCRSLIVRLNLTHLCINAWGVPLVGSHQFNSVS